MHLRAALLGTLMLDLMGSGAWAQQKPPADGIYTCTDAAGRKLRSDRPIPACVDREQRVLNPSGTERARIGPTLTPQQRAEEEARMKAEAQQQFQEREERRRDRALLTRYPTRSVHDGERAETKARIEAVTQAAFKRIDILREERKQIDRELEFYQGDPEKAPPALRRQIEYVTQGMESQQRFVRLQQEEIGRIDARFDEELVRLNGLWTEQAATPSAAPRAGRP